MTAAGTRAGSIPKLIARGRTATAQTIGAGIRVVTDRALAAPLCAGLAIRALLAPYTSWPGDDIVWYQAAISGAHRLDLYARHEFSYPPLWGHVLAGLGAVASDLGVQVSSFASADPRLGGLSAHALPSVITSPGFNLAFKSILLGFDLATALVVYTLVARLTGSPAKARAGFALWFLNPFVIFESSVHGAFDGVVAFFVIAAIALAYLRRPFWTGLALGAGVMAKVTPVLLAPLLLVLLSLRPRSLSISTCRTTGLRGLIDVVAAAKFVAGGVLVTGLVFVPELSHGTVNDAINATLSRVSSHPVVGGVSLFGFTNFIGLDAVGRLPSTHHGLTDMLVLVGEIGGVLVATIWAAVRAAADRAYALLAGSLLILGTWVAVEPLAQPQYVLWLLPCALVIAVVWDLGRWQLVILSLAPVLFVLAVLGPLTVLVPLAKYTGFASIPTIATHALSWISRSSVPWSDTTNEGFTALATLLCVVAMVTLAITLLRARIPRMDANPEAEAASGQTRPKRWRAELIRPPQVALVGALLLIVICQAVAYLGPAARASGPLRLTSQAIGGGRLRLSLQVAPQPGQDVVRLFAVPVATAGTARRVLIYSDPRYPLSGADSFSLPSTAEHTTVEMKLRSRFGQVNQIDAAQLAQVLEDPRTASHTAILVLGGVLPRTAYSLKRNLVTPWLRQGGLLFWAGDEIGFYSGRPGQDVFPLDALDPGDPGPAFLLGSRAVRAIGWRTAAIASTPSPTASGLGLLYADTNVTVDPHLVQSTGGAVIGWEDARRSSISVIPVGSGKTVIFAGAVSDPELVARDLSVILLSRIDQAEGAASFVDLPASGGPRTYTWTVKPPFGAAALEVGAFDPGLEGLQFETTTVPLPSTRSAPARSKPAGRGKQRRGPAGRRKRRRGRGKQQRGKP